MLLKMDLSGKMSIEHTKMNNSFYNVRLVLTVSPNILMLMKYCETYSDLEEIMPSPCPPVRMERKIDGSALTLSSPV